MFFPYGETTCHILGENILGQFNVCFPFTSPQSIQNFMNNLEEKALMYKLLSLSTLPPSTADTFDERLSSRNVLRSLAVHCFISSLFASAFSRSHVQNFCLLPLPCPLPPLAFIPIFLPCASSQQRALLHVLSWWFLWCPPGEDAELVTVNEALTSACSALSALKLTQARIQ